jgi:WD40 repeat protein
VQGCAISADGSLVASASSDQTAILWSTASGRPLHVLAGHESAIHGCAFSPDGTLLATAAADGTVRLWNVQSGMQTGYVQRHERAANRCTFSADGRWLLSASADGSVKVGVLDGSEPERRFIGHDDWVNDCAISADGTLIASASSDASVKLWDAGLRGTDERPSFAPMLACAADRDRGWVACGFRSGALTLHDAPSGQVLLSRLEHTDEVRCCAFHGDGSKLVTASADKSLVVWAVTAGSLNKTATLLGHTDGANAAAFSPSGHLVASGANDRTLRLWDLRTSARKLAFVAHRDSISGCLFSPDGAHVVSASFDGTLKRWSAHIDETLWERWFATGRSLGFEAAEEALEPLVFSGHERAVNGCALSPDGRWLASASDDHTLKLWSLHSGALQNTLSGHASHVTGCAFHPGGEWIASVSRDGAVKVWHAASGGCAMGLQVDGSLAHCTWVADDSLVAVGSAGVYFLGVQGLAAASRR